MRPHTPLSENVELVVDHLETCTVITLRGDLRSDTTAGLRDRLLPMLRHATTPVVFDMSGVASCDASGLALLVGAQRRAELHGIRITLAGPHAKVGKLLRSTGLHRIFTIYPSATDAIQAHLKQDALCSTRSVRDGGKTFDGRPGLNGHAAVLAGADQEVAAQPA